MFSVVVLMPGMVERAFAQPAGEGVTACGQFVAAHPFGETEFAFQHSNFERCSPQVPHGLTLVDAVVAPLAHSGDKYIVTCQCARDSLEDSSPRE